MRIAVLGLGSAGRRHAANLRELGAEVVGWDPGVSDPPDGIDRAVGPEQALAAADAAVIASPSSLHAEQAGLAIAAGVPVLVEKPLATTTEAAERVAARASERGVACGVAMNLRFHPAIRRLKGIIEEGQIGKVVRANAWFGYDLRRWRPQSDYRDSYSARADLGGGIVLDAIHELDYLLWLLGPATAVTAATARVSDLEIDVEDTAVAVIKLVSGALATVDVNFVEPAYRRGCVLTGTEASAEWDWNAGSIAVIGAGERREIDVSADVAATYRAEAEDFLGFARGDRQPAVPAEEGLEAVRLADAIKRAAGTGSRVELPQA